MHQIDCFFDKTLQICNSQHIIKHFNSTLCVTGLNIIKQMLPQVKSQRVVLAQFLGHNFPKSQTRVKCGWFDFIGKAAKILFGTLDNDDA